MKNMVIVSGLLALAGTAMGQMAPTGYSFDTRQISEPGMELRPQTDRVGGQTVISLAGLASWDVLGSGNNVVLNVDIAAALGMPSGSPVNMNGIGWDLSVQTVGASWRSEARLYFDDNVAPDLLGLFLNPFTGQNSSGAGTSTSGGIIKLADVQIANIPLPNGILRLELFESFDDVPNEIDAFWGGSITVQTVEIPAPGVAGLFGIAGLAAARRRR